MENIVMPEEFKSYRRFIQKFSKAYFTGCGKIPNIKYVQSLEETEKRVLSGSFENKSDFYWMMAWKMGKIKKDGNLFSGWSDRENPVMYRNSKKQYVLNLSELHDLIMENKDELKRHSDNGNPVKFIDRILQICRDENIKGIGPVYAIAILFFFSNGKYPIYDRFARIGVECIIGNRPHIPRAGESKKLPEFDYKVDYPRYLKLIEKAQIKYYTKENKNYLENRMVDQALWVYGHGYK